MGEADKPRVFQSVACLCNAGFTVKGIANVQEDRELKALLESVLKLAELYTQQGLFNDARAQYLQVA